MPLGVSPARATTGERVPSRAPHGNRWGGRYGNVPTWIWFPVC